MKYVAILLVVVSMVFSGFCQDFGDSFNPADRRPSSAESRDDKDIIPSSLEESGDSDTLPSAMEDTPKVTDKITDDQSNALREQAIDELIANFRTRTIVEHPHLTKCTWISVCLALTSVLLVKAEAPEDIVMTVSVAGGVSLLIGLVSKRERKVLVDTRTDPSQAKRKERGKKYFR